MNAMRLTDPKYQELFHVIRNIHVTAAVFRSDNIPHTPHQRFRLVGAAKTRAIP